MFFNVRLDIRPAAALALVAGLALMAPPMSRAQAQAEPPAAPDKMGPKLPGAPGGPAEKEQDFPKWDEVSKDYQKVNTTPDGAMWTLWTRQKDAQVLAELPRDYESRKYFFAMTLSSGSQWAGLQGANVMVNWKRYDKRLALIEPNTDVRSTGDDASKLSVGRVFTDRVMLDIPIVCIGPNGGPVIDMDALLLGQATKFFGYEGRGLNASLSKIAEAKSFPNNIEVAFEAPAANGELRTFHYSISVLPERTGYQPRVEDERVGYFTTNYRDLGKFGEDEKWVRYINRWNIEKADPKLKLSPPKEPIVYYLEDSIPIRYRRYVKAGVLYWNKAFEKVGIKDAIEVYVQDKATGQNMDKDPEDVRYNFIRWVSNDIATAIGPSRADPRTGQILDADIVTTDGWIRVFWNQVNRLMPEMAMEGMSPEALAWLDRRPQWDPRVRLVPPAEREHVVAQLAAERANRGLARFGSRGVGGFPDALELASPTSEPGPWDARRRLNEMCMAASGKAFDMAVMGMQLEIDGLLGDDDDDAPADKPKDDKDKKKHEGKDDDKNGKEKNGEKDKEKDKNKPDKLDGIPEWFVGPVLADLICHEVGHTLGLRHNFKASSIYSLDKINSEEFKGKKAFTGSVMDYTPVNINMKDGPIQGDFAMIDIGPYDMWAIEYGYTFGDPKEVLKRVAEPELAYATDEDTVGPDPLARRYDFAANPLDYANSRMKLAKYHRDRLLEKYVKEGQSWYKARRGYLMTLNEQLGSLSMMARWVGGSYVNRDRKGDPNGRPPVQDVSVEQQRAALKYCIENAFTEGAFGLTPELLAHMTTDKFQDGGGSMEDATYPVHDRIMGIQASVLTMLMNPGTMRRVYDNEFRVAGDKDALTMPELINAISDAIWGDLGKPDKRFTARQPMISSLRRDLQREHLERLIDLAFPDTFGGASAKPASNLAIAKLREIEAKITAIIDGGGKDRLDPYSYSHLSEAKLRIDKALDASYIYNTDKIGGGGFPAFLFFGTDGKGGAAMPGTSGNPGMPGSDSPSSGTPGASPTWP